MPPLCAHSMWALGKTGLSSDLHGQDNLNSLIPSDAIWLQILVIIGFDNGLSVRCQAIA